ncbi:unnamed protein product [Sphenostylis stenocarpa]|uniref:Uncharacterized protein n=1 Tax=Sphenostylis stenocarpa TaxID=92480 RepID=A0AA86SDB9_9FABA|nr:unnamed protein product [Sphenostylis stenocarpa]
MAEFVGERRSTFPTNREVAESRGVCRVKNGSTLTKYRFVGSKLSERKIVDPLFCRRVLDTSAKQWAVSSTCFTARDSQITFSIEWRDRPIQKCMAALSAAIKRSRE